MKENIFERIEFIIPKKNKNFLFFLQIFLIPLILGIIFASIYFFLVQKKNDDATGFAFYFTSFLVSTIYFVIVLIFRTWKEEKIILDGYGIQQEPSGMFFDLRKTEIQFGQNHIQCTGFGKRIVIPKSLQGFEIFKERLKSILESFKFSIDEVSYAIHKMAKRNLELMFVQAEINTKTIALYTKNVFENILFGILILSSFFLLLFSAINLYKNTSLIPSKNFVELELLGVIFFSSIGLYFAKKFRNLILIFPEERKIKIKEIFSKEKELTDFETIGINSAKTIGFGSNVIYIEKVSYIFVRTKDGIHRIGNLELNSNIIQLVIDSLLELTNAKYEDVKIGYSITNKGIVKEPYIFDVGTKAIFFFLGIGLVTILVQMELVSRF
jgi:hypothetical protein